MSYSVLIVLGLLAVCDGQLTLRKSPYAKTMSTSFVGRYQTTEKGVSYASFEGIGYAKPPIGRLRFKDPIAKQLPNGVYDATKAGDICIQPNENGTAIVGGEDCLYLNIFVPLNQTILKRGLPVLFHIHGGAFVTGYANMYNIEPFLEAGFLVIEFNYRLGPFGFLCLQTPDVPGNAAMKDQVLVLRWVKKYIQDFGGDPNNISVWGESAGGTAAQMQQLSPMVNKLFNRIISMSGSSLAEYGIQARPLEKAAILAQLLGLDISDHNFLENLQAIDAVTVLGASLLLQPTLDTSLLDFPFAPVIETKFKGIEAFLTRPPIAYIRSGKYNQVPVIFGATSLEAVFFYNPAAIDLNVLIRSVGTVVPLHWQAVLSETGRLKVYQTILLYFFGTSDVDLIDLTDHENLERLIDLFSDTAVFIAIDTAVRELAKTSMKPVYYYRFSYLGLLNGAPIVALGLVGATHIDEIYFVCPFESPRIGEYTPDGWTRRRLVKIIENFGYTNEPTPGNCTHLLPTKWLPATKYVTNYMEIDGTLTPSTDPVECRVRFWSKLEDQVYAGLFN